MVGVATGWPKMVENYLIGSALLKKVSNTNFPTAYDLEWAQSWSLRSISSQIHGRSLKLFPHNCHSQSTCDLSTSLFSTSSLSVARQISHTLGTHSSLYRGTRRGRYSLTHSLTSTILPSLLHFTQMFLTLMIGLLILILYAVFRYYRFVSRYSKGPTPLPFIGNFLEVNSQCGTSQKLPFRWISLTKPKFTRDSVKSSTDCVLSSFPFPLFT